MMYVVVFLKLLLTVAISAFGYIEKCRIRWRLFAIVARSCLLKGGVLWSSVVSPRLGITL